MRAGGLALCACLAVMAAALHARADAPVELRESACREAPLEQVLPALRVELRERLAEDGTGEGSYRLYARCEDDTLTVRVVARDGAEQTFETRLKGTADDVRARVVALAIAEIVRDLPAQREPPVAAAPAPPPPSPVPTPVRKRAPEQALGARAKVGAFGQASIFAANGTWLAGGGLGTSYRWQHLALGLNAALLTSHHDVALGSARAFVVYAEPELAYALGLRHAELRAGAAFALGLSKLDGRAQGSGSRDATVRTPFLAPSLFVQASRELTRELALFVRVQLGAPLETAIGQIPGAKDIQIRGAWTSLMLGASYAFGPGAQGLPHTR